MIRSLAQPSTRSRSGVAAATGVLALALTGLAAAPADAAGVQRVHNWDGIVAAFAHGGTVRLTKDIDDPGGTHDSLAVGADKSVTFDLHGHSLTVDNANPDDAGINVPSDATLTVKDNHPGKTNSLTVIGGTDWSESTGGAGIGGNSRLTGSSAGHVTIRSGTVVATGGDFGAGIGGGDGGTDGTITIAGGTVTAVGGGGGAGIGGGYGAGRTVNGTITITGGTVTATGGDSAAAGIGGGGFGAGGTISISGGTVSVTGGDIGGAGIGSGNDGDAGTIKVTGGDVTATSGTDAAGVGSGWDGSGGDVTIGTDATVTATGGVHGDASAVGSGNGATNPGPFVNRGRLILPEGATLRVPAGASVKNAKRGVIDNHGQILGDGGELINKGTITNGAHATIADHGNGAAGDTSMFRISGHNYTLTYSFGSTYTSTQHVYAATLAAATKAVRNNPAPGYAWLISGQTDPTALTRHTNLQEIAGDGPATIALTGAAVTDPTITAHLHPGKPKKKHHGWYRSHKVRVTFTCSAGSAPVVACPKARTFKANGVHKLTRTIRATDSGTTTAKVTVRIDHKVPTLKVTGVKKNRTYKHQPKIRCHATDAHSGIKKVGKSHEQCVIKKTKTARHGKVTTWRYTVTARDKAGNKAVKKGNYQVRR